MPLWLDNLYLDAVDALHALRPPVLPGRERLQAGRVISHRGERDGHRILENTLPAFDALRGSGIFGIEFDVRWTRDLQPVVFHDADLRRLFGEPDRIAELSRAQLAARHPEIPGLASFIRRYVGEFHLMVELKSEAYPDPGEQARRLLDALAPALDGDRCHVLSMDPDLLRKLPGLPAQRTLSVARLNTRPISAEALDAGRAGIAAHYTALDRELIEAHHAAGQVVGCGFPRSRTVLFRELARGVDYIFTNHAARVDGWRRKALAT